MRARDLIALLALMTFSCAHRPTTVLFLCPHGAAKSLVAATYFNELAAQRGLAMRATAAATEEPYEEVPAFVVDAIGVTDFTPRRVTPADLDSAARVVTIDCDPKTIPAGKAGIERWDDVPKMSEDLAGSISAIRAHVAQMVEELLGGV